MPSAQSETFATHARAAIGPLEVLLFKTTYPVINLIRRAGNKGLVLGKWTVMHVNPETARVDPDFECFCFQMWSMGRSGLLV